MTGDAGKAKGAQPEGLRHGFTVLWTVKSKYCFHLQKNKYILSHCSREAIRFEQRVIIMTKRDDIYKSTEERDFRLE